jgi:hypothetical protein
MKRSIATSLSLLAAITLVGLSNASAAKGNEPNFDAWSCTFRNIHLGSKAFKELNRLIFDEVIPNAEVKDLLLYKP